MPNDPTGTGAARAFGDCVSNGQLIVVTAPLVISPTDGQLDEDVTLSLPSQYTELTAAEVAAPTITETTNVDSSVSAKQRYLRIGNQVFVSGSVTVDATAGAATEIGIALPVASTLGAVADLSGSIVDEDGAGIGPIIGNVANNRAQANFVTVDGDSVVYQYSFSYTVI